MQGTTNVGSAAGADDGGVPFADTALPAHTAALCSLRLPRTPTRAHRLPAQPSPAPTPPCHRFMLNFQMPDAALRAKLWRAAVPQQTPLAGGWSVRGVEVLVCRCRGCRGAREPLIAVAGQGLRLRLDTYDDALNKCVPCAVAGDVDWSVLGDRYELSGGHIRNAVIRAATRAALRMGAGAGAGAGKGGAAGDKEGGDREKKGVEAGAEKDGGEGKEKEKGKAGRRGAKEEGGLVEGVVCMADLVAEAQVEVGRGEGAMQQQVRAMYM